MPTIKSKLLKRAIITDNTPSFHTKRKVMLFDYIFAAIDYGVWQRTQEQIGTV